MLLSMTKNENIKTTDMKEAVISAKGRSLGRVATEAARILMGKDTPHFSPNLAPRVRLTITDVSTLTMTAVKKGQKTYARYSGYPGGLTKETMEDVITKKGMDEVLRLAIYGMLPANKLRALRMKALVLAD